MLKIYYVGLFCEISARNNSHIFVNVLFTGHEVAGKVTLKHVYEIAQIKSQDPVWETIDLKEVCKSVIACAHTIGVEVVRDLDPREYGEFLEERCQIVEEEEAALLEAKQAKLLRVT